MCLSLTLSQIGNHTVVFRYCIYVYLVETGFCAIKHPIHEWVKQFRLASKSEFYSLGQPSAIITGMQHKAGLLSCFRCITLELA